MDLLLGEQDVAGVGVKKGCAQQSYRLQSILDPGRAGELGNLHGGAVSSKALNIEAKGSPLIQLLSSADAINKYWRLILNSML